MGIDFETQKLLMNLMEAYADASLDMERAISMDDVEHCSRRKDSAKEGALYLLKGELSLAESFLEKTGR